MRAFVQNRRYVGFIGCVVAGLAALSVGGCPQIVPAGGFDPTNFAGVYVGNWSNAATGATGSARIEIVIDHTAKTATLLIDFGGNYLGLGDPPQTELTGTFDEHGARLHSQTELFGTADVLMAADGSMVGVYENVGGGAVPLLTYTGTLTAAQLHADYSAVLANGTVIHAVAELTKQ